MSDHPCTASDQQPAVDDQHPAVDDHRWVLAVPFRSHLRHLMAAGPLDADEVAILTGVSSAAVRHILWGRHGRPQRKICPETAHKILLVTPADVRALAWCLTPAAPARAAYARLREEGLEDVEVARACRVEPDELEALAAGAPRCSRLLSVRVCSLSRRLLSFDLTDVEEPAEDADAA